MTERDRSADYERREQARLQEIANLEKNIAAMIARNGIARTLAEIVSDPQGFRFHHKD